MKMMKSVAAAAAATLVLGMSLPYAMAKDETKKIGSAVSVLKEVAATPKKGIPPELLKEADAIAFVPGAAKLDFMTSGRHGSGFMLVHDEKGKWSSPVFITLSGGTLGWQIVGEPMDIILVFKSKKVVDGIMKGKFTMGAKTKVAQGPVGRSLKEATDKERKAEINSYVRSRGEFAEATLVGANVQIDAAANDAFYGKPKVGAEDIVTGKVEKQSAEITNLWKLLNDYSARK